MAEQDFDVVVLGGGSGGYACALRAAQLGLRVALVERDRLGGTCLHVGCIPTKAILHAAEIADSAREAAQFGVQATLDGIDMAGLQKYKDRVVNRLFKGLSGLVKSRGIELAAGHGRVVAPRTVEVDGRVLTGRHLVLATGSFPRTLPGVEVDGRRVLTSEHALTLDRVPGSVIVLGGGVIGVEFASAWRSLGADVTVVEALPRLIASEDEDSARALARAFGRRGIEVVLGTAVSQVETLPDGVRVTTADGVARSAELLLVAVGRGPSTAGLGLAEQGVELETGFVVTDERLRTSVERTYAVGDIVRGPQLAHRGFAHGIFVAEDIAGMNPPPIDDTGLPRVAYCRPEVASVGLTEAAAKDRYGADVQTFTYDLAGNGRSQILATTGSVKVVRQPDGPVVGIHLVGDHVGELIGEAQLIYGWEALPEDVAGLVHAHPTQAEALGEAHLALAGKPLHVHG